MLVKRLTNTKLGFQNVKILQKNVTDDKVSTYTRLLDWTKRLRAYSL